MIMERWKGVMMLKPVQAEDQWLEAVEAKIRWASIKVPLFSFLFLHAAVYPHTHLLGWFPFI